ncbi:MAG: baseplate wedge protein 53, partial [Paraclostridium sp.]
LSLIEKMGDITTITYNLLNDYKDEIISRCVTIKMSNEEFLRYQYKPRLLAYDIYGDVELFFIILFVNNLCNVKEFNNKRVKMLKKEDLTFILSAIYNAEYDTIKKNRNKIEI